MSNTLKEYEEVRKRYQNDVEASFAAKDILNYNEVLFSAHSCAIEGNSFSVNDTRELKEHGLNLKLHNKSMFEAFEILDHFKAFEFLFTPLPKQFLLSEKLLIDTHKYLTRNTIKFSKGYNPGEYTKTQMAAGDTIFPDFKMSIKSIPALLEQTQKALDQDKIHPVEIAAKFHQYFIYLHPFPDGNGRLGRLMSNYILAIKKHPLIIIQAKVKQEYIHALKASHKHKDTAIITSFFLKHSIARMKEELKQKNIEIPGTKRTRGKGLSFIF